MHKIEAEVNWGLEAVEVSNEMEKLIKELLMVVRRHVDHNLHRKDEDFQVLYGGTEMNEFSGGLFQATEKLREYLKDYLLLK